MDDHDAVMLAFVKLAGISQSRDQLGPRDKFLVLAGVAASRAGHPAVAQRCRELVLANNRAHLLKRYETFTRALEDGEFQTYFKQVSRFCSYEKAEHHLSQLDISAELPKITAKLSPEDYALLLLGRAHER
jgi:hypothetical protein